VSASVKTESLESLLAACDRLASRYRTFAPTIEDAVTGFRPLDEMTKEQRKAVEAVAFANKPPVGSVKSFFFPDSEIYIKFSREGKAVKQREIDVSGPQIILGAKPCDIKSIELLDKVFLAEPIDTMYQEKRQKTIVIVATCHETGDTCACQEFGVQPVASPADILMAKGGSAEIFLTPLTVKGEKLMEELSSVGSFAVCAALPLPVFDGVVEELSAEQVQKRMDELFNSPVWDRLAMTCIGCGTCTYYCPTCHCYDIRDFSRRDHGVRYRTWDSCMFSNFTNMAGGHNPRPTRSDRLRNRFFHKLNYFVKKHGELACVGCGRCAELCPVGISISSVLKEIGGDLHES